MHRIARFDTLKALQQQQQSDEAVTPSIHTLCYNTHKPTLNMMQWAENGIIMKFTWGKTHSYQTVGGGRLNIKIERDEKSLRR